MDATGRFWGVWTPRGLQQLWAGLWHAFPRAVAGRSICCLPKETRIGFDTRTMPMWEGGMSVCTAGARSLDEPQGRTTLEEEVETPWYK